MADSASTSSDWEPPSPEALQQLLPQYEITGILGRGGMGAVYKGRQAKLHRDVAIKLLPETLTEGGDEFNFTARFEQEARAMASLDHPAIVSVHDFGETSEGQLYFVMEFIDGMDIHQYLQHHGGAVPEEQALAIVCHVLDALDYAHDRGIVHRDIKPANVLLNQEGRVKIADFGLAKTLAAGDEPAAPALTMTNMAMGTPDYAAPEMLELGTAPDHRVDLYAVGVMLYQLLTGKLPRGNFQTPSELQPALDPRLDGIVSKAMEADPDRRYGRASEIRGAIDEVLSRPMTRVEGGGEESTAPAAVSPGEVRQAGGAKKKAVPTPKPGAPAGLWWGLGIGGVVAVVAAVVLLGGGDDKAETGGDTVRPLVAAVTPEPEANPEAKAQPEPETEPEPEPKPVEPAPEPATGPKPANPAPANPAPEVVAAVTEADAPPKPETSSTPPAPADSPPDPPATGPAPAADPAAPTPAKPADPLAATAIPGLEPRLRSYLKARSEAVEKLAVGYLRALDGRLNQAADAGDLPLAKAWREERSRVEELQKALAAPVADPVAAAREEATLPALAEDAPEALATLRATWTTEREKIRADLDGKLETTLKTLEVELTQARDFEKAEAVLAYRESLGTAAPALAAVEPKPAAPALASSPDLARATKDAPFENSLGMKFVPVKGTDVLFCIHETRWRDYEEYAKRADNVAPNWKNQTHEGFPIKDDPEDHPVVNVSWEDAQAFCKWLSEKEGKTYRLPTDREWSIAVGIGREEDWKSDTTPETVFKPQDIFPWGKDWPPPKGAGNYSDESRKEKAPNANAQYQEGYDDGFPTTAPVMRFEPNEHGLFDLGGNVWEWCEDWFNSSHEHSVLRGGSWFDGERGSLLSSGRSRPTPVRRNGSSGFRVVLVSSGG